MKTGCNSLFMFINKSLAKKGMWKKRYQYIYIYIYIYIYQLTEDSDKEHNWYHAAKWGIEKSVCN